MKNLKILNYNIIKALFGASRWDARFFTFKVQPNGFPVGKQSKHPVGMYVR